MTIEIFLQIFGIASLLSIVLILFSTRGDKPRNLKAISPVHTDDQNFLSTVSRSVHASVEFGGTIEPLNNGSEFYPSLLNAIHNAKSNINIAVYIWKEGEIVDRVTEALLSKLKEGKEVRIILDGFGSRVGARKQFKKLKQTGAKIKKFRSLSFSKIYRFYKRNHRRAIIIDGKTGFTGGMAISDKWKGSAKNPQEWRDIMFKVEGPMARSLQSAFSDIWASSGEEILTGNKFYPENFQENSKIPYIHLISSPSADTQPLPIFLFLSIMSAKKKINIATPYFIPEQALLKALIEQSKKGIEVTILLPSNKTDAKPVRWASHYFYGSLLEAGVKIYEYQPTFMHSKLLIIDDVWSIVGSANLNNRSTDLDEENIFGILDQNFGTKLKNIFEEDLKQSIEVKLDKWLNRSPISKTNEQFWWLFTKQF